MSSLGAHGSMVRSTSLVSTIQPIEFSNTGPRNQIGEAWWNIQAPSSYSRTPSPSISSRNWILHDSASVLSHDDDTVTLDTPYGSTITVQQSASDSLKSTLPSKFFFCDNHQGYYVDLDHDYMQAIDIDSLFKPDKSPLSSAKVPRSIHYTEIPQMPTFGASPPGSTRTRRSIASVPEAEDDDILIRAVPAGASGSYFPWSASLGSDRLQENVSTIGAFAPPIPRPRSVQGCYLTAPDTTFPGTDPIQSSQSRFTIRQALHDCFSEICSNAKTTLKSIWSDFLSHVVVNAKRDESTKYDTPADRDGSRPTLSDTDLDSRDELFDTSNPPPPGHPGLGPESAEATTRRLQTRHPQAPGQVTDTNLMTDGNESDRLYDTNDPPPAYAR